MILISISDRKIPTEELVLPLLGAYARIIGQDARGGQYSHTESGAPIVSGVAFPVYVSASHSDNRVAVALSQSPVGIDVERIREVDFAKISSRFGVKSENKEAFYRYWTSAEAYMKGAGVPLTEALKNPNDSVRVLPVLSDYALAVFGKGDIFIYPYSQLLP